MAEDEAAPEQLCRLLDLPAELLLAKASQLSEDDELATSLAELGGCRSRQREMAQARSRRLPLAAVSEARI
jgi:hypothetical protein